MRCGGLVAGRSELQQGAPAGEPGQEARRELGIAQQREQGGREAEGEPGRLGRISAGGLQDIEQGDVALEQGLEVPVLLQRPLNVGTDVGKMGVEDQGQLT